MRLDCCEGAAVLLLRAGVRGGQRGMLLAGVSIEVLDCWEPLNLQPERIFIAGCLHCWRN